MVSDDIYPSNKENSCKDKVLSFDVVATVELFIMAVFVVGGQVFRRENGKITIVHIIRR